VAGVAPQQLAQRSRLLGREAQIVGAQRQHRLGRHQPVERHRRQFAGGQHHLARVRQTTQEDVERLQDLLGAVDSVEVVEDQQEWLADGRQVGHQQARHADPLGALLESAAEGWQHPRIA
jgi:hypothetical protein